MDLLKQVCLRRRLIESLFIIVRLARTYLPTSTPFFPPDLARSAIDHDLADFCFIEVREAKACEVDLKHQVSHRLK
ncbi:MAG: hypothetical protein CL472_04430 [Acidobacteria bacterium]|nr:hypothetical protein [Acidobacteriota bacterium]|tara:strand:+ start:424 stop:651 length:228 start_codon:yes stop_codon:yes gene_type:complete